MSRTGKNRVDLPEEKKLPNEEVLVKLEEEVDASTGKTGNYKGRSDIRMLNAEEERRYQKIRRARGLKTKKYDGRVAGARANTSLVRTKEVLTDFYASVKLPELKAALEISNDPRYNTLLSMLNNPRFNNTSFPELCKRSRMSLQDVINAWRSHVQNQGITRMMQHLPDIMEDVAIDSKSRWVICGECAGEGKIHGAEFNKVKDPICTVCNGDGKVRIVGDKDARNLAFEVVGMRKTGGINVNVAQQVNTGGIKSVEDQIMDIDKVFDVQTIKEIGDGNSGEERVSEAVEETDEDREAARELAEKEGSYR